MPTILAVFELRPLYQVCIARRGANDRAADRASLVGHGYGAAWDGVGVANSWLSVRVDLLHGSHAGDLWPTPGRLLAVGPRHSFRDLAEAIDDAFARWDRSHLCEFTLADGRRIARPDPEWDEEPVSDYARTSVARTARLGTEFRYVFDLGDFWVHRCTVGPKKIDPVEALGIEPDRPLAYFGWGTIPDQYGRRWDGDDGTAPEPRPPVDADPMVSSSWPQSAEIGPPRLRGGDLPALRGATVRRDRAAVAALLPGRNPVSLLQHAGDALLAVGLAGMEETAREVERLLRERGGEGDVNLADALAGRLGDAVPMLRPVPADLDQVAALMSAAEAEAGGWLDLRTGEAWPAAAVQDAAGVDGPDSDADPRRWLAIEGEGSHWRWADRRDFAAGLRPGPLPDRLLDALKGRGAFRRFSRALEGEPERLEEWRAFSAERQRGRARALLTVHGYTPLPPQLSSQP